MYCRNCGSEINDNAVVCIHCGCAVEQPKQQQQSAPQAKSNVLAIVGFIMAFLMPIAGLICSIIGYKNADKDYNGNGKSLALAGTIISAITLVLTLALIIWAIVVWVIAIGAIAGTVPYYCIFI